MMRHGDTVILTKRISEMSQYDIYVFILCLLVFVMLAGLSSVMLTCIVKSSMRLIRLGADDEKIKGEYFKELKRKRCGKVIDYVVSTLLCAILIGFFGFSVFVNIRKDSYFENIPTLRVVNTASMATKHEKNTYLTANGLNDQFNAFDMILTYKLPPMDELELYQIVVYEVDGVLIVHRIVGIEEPNQAHPNERYFLCQGDAVEKPDRFPVRYEQMRAIYRGERVPFIGSFVSFMQSPAGWLCIILIVTALIATPILEKSLGKEKRFRLISMGIIPPDGIEDDDSPAIDFEMLERHRREAAAARARMRVIARKQRGRPARARQISRARAVERDARPRQTVKEMNDAQ